MRGKRKWLARYKWRSGQIVTFAASFRRVALASDNAPNAVQFVPAFMEYCHAPLALSAPVTAMPRSAKPSTSTLSIKRESVYPSGCWTTHVNDLPKVLFRAITGGVASWKRLAHVMFTCVQVVGDEGNVSPQAYCEIIVGRFHFECMLAAFIPISETCRLCQIAGGEVWLEPYRN